MHVAPIKLRPAGDAIDKVKQKLKSDTNPFCLNPCTKNKQKHCQFTGVKELPKNIRDMIIEWRFEIIFTRNNCS
jgi:hypothetical protein